MNSDEKNRFFEKWYQNFIRSHDVGNPAKWREFTRWAFWGGMEVMQAWLEQQDVQSEMQSPLMYKPKK
jgi:hypothetical protein